MAADSKCGLLLSGGIDSAVLLGHLLEMGQSVQPFYVRTDFVWHRAELRAARRVAHALVRRAKSKEPTASLVVLEMPLADLFEDHWSVTGRGTPALDSHDQAVYLPGHNALLLLKATLWCLMRGIDRIALASLKNNPFADATEEFFVAFQEAIRLATGDQVTVVRPFENWTKDDVMRRGRDFPLELTFSCLAPVGLRHCGRCNKCAERQRAFRGLAVRDPTRYADEHQEPQASER